MSGYWTCDGCGEPVNFPAPVGRWDRKERPCPYHCGGRAKWRAVEVTVLPKQDTAVTVAPHVERAIAESGFQQMREAMERAKQK